MNKPLTTILLLASLGVMGQSKKQDAKLSEYHGGPYFPPEGSPYLTKINLGVSIYDGHISPIRIISGGNEAYIQLTTAINGKPDTSIQIYGDTIQNIKTMFLNYEKLQKMYISLKEEKHTHGMYIFSDNETKKPKVYRQRKIINIKKP